MDTTAIEANFPYRSRYLEVYGSRVHYIEEGTGSPILFLHGNPTSSYLWRNIIPHCTDKARCIAPDLIGMGKSDKPKIDYRFNDHYRYIVRFIEKMDLTDITLVIHDWGSALGFNYAMHHPENVKGIAFMEAILDTAEWDDFPSEFKAGFKLFRTPVIGWFMISVMNMFVDKILPEAIIRDLSEEEMKHYRAPFRNIAHRKPVRVWPKEIPINGKPKDVHNIVDRFNSWLQGTGIPKLLFHASPGVILRDKQIQWCTENLPNLKTVDLGKGLHFLQEDHPHIIGRELSQWYVNL